MSLIWIGRQVTGPLVDRPDPNDPRLEARVGNEAMFTDSDTGKQYLTNGQVWTPGGIPGLTGDGQTPGGVGIAGNLAVQAGSGSDAFTVNYPTHCGPGSVTAGDPASQSSYPPTHTLYGITLLQDTIDPGGPTLEVDQSAAPTTNHTYSALLVRRTFQAGNFDYTGPVVSIANEDIAAELLHATGPSVGNVFRVGSEGGIGCFNHAAQTAPRTLAQSAITAITDANAKTAVQAIANALADIGALTLT